MLAEQPISLFGEWPFESHESELWTRCACCSTRTADACARFDATGSRFVPWIHESLTSRCLTKGAPVRADDLRAQDREVPNPIARSAADRSATHRRTNPPPGTSTRHAPGATGCARSPSRGRSGSPPPSHGCRGITVDDLRVDHRVRHRDRARTRVRRQHRTRRHTGVVRPRKTTTPAIRTTRRVERTAPEQAAGAVDSRV